jgi:hypothetical protein
VVALIPLSFPLVVDTCVLQPPIATSVTLYLLRRCCRKGQYLGLVSELLEMNIGSAPVPKNGSIAETEIFLRECQGGFHQRQRFKSGYKNKRRTSQKLRIITLILSQKTGWEGISLLI